VNRIKDPQAYRKAVEDLIRDKLGKSGVWNAFQEYAERSPKSCLEWFIQADGLQEGLPVVELCDRDIELGREYATSAYGKKRAEQLAEMVDKWAIHLSQYAQEVLRRGPETIVELGGGAGLGTDALLRKGLQDAKLISIDIDFACCKVIEGLTRWYKVAARVDPVVANFWFLPLGNKSIDLVCSHYGLDESREVPRVIQEIGRVLVRGGRFVNVSRSDPALRLSQWLGHLDFSFDELGELAVLSRLYPGPERLIQIAEQQGLRLVSLDQVSLASSHDRTIFVFIKDQG
jgi:SAM-dependent methyltransferase